MLYLVFYDKYGTYPEFKPPKEDYSPLDKSAITIRRDDEDGNLAYSFSGEIVFQRSAYQYLYQKLIIGEDGIFGQASCAQVNVKVYDDCCKITDVDGQIVDKEVFNGKIMGDAIEFCDGNCEITTNIMASDDYTEIVTCLKSTYVYQNDFVYEDGKRFQQREHPFIRYCIAMQPTFIHDLFFILGIGVVAGLVPVLAIVGTIVTTINVVIAGINVIPGVNIPYIGGDISFFDDVFTILDFVNKYIMGCGNGHPAPFVRDYVRNVCEICGLQFKSSILNNPDSAYYNVMRLDAPVSKGTENYTSFIWDNKPLLTGHDFMAWLCLVFDGKFKIVDRDLIFEHRSYFKNTEVWLDLSAGVIDEGNIIKVCYKYPNKPKPAFGQFQITQDGMDWVGNEAKVFYEDIVAWGEPIEKYPCFEGIDKRILPFGPARFRFDGISRDVPSFWSNFVLAMGGPFLIPLYNLLKDEKYKNALYLPQEKCFEPKLLIWDGFSELREAKVLRFPVEFASWLENPLFVSPSGGVYLHPIGTDDLLYNHPMWVNAGIGSQSRDVNTNETPIRKPYFPVNLYTKFWYWEDSRRQATAGFQYTAEIIRTGCDELDGLSFEKVVLLPHGQTGSIQEVTISADKLTIVGMI